MSYLLIHHHLCNLRMTVSQEYMERDFNDAIDILDIVSMHLVITSE